MTKEIQNLTADEQVAALEALQATLEQLSAADKAIPQIRISLTSTVSPEIREARKYLTEATLAIKNAMIAIQSDGESTLSESDRDDMSGC
jgi:uncharacterized protein